MLIDTQRIEDFFNENRSRSLPTTPGVVDKNVKI